MYYPLVEAVSGYTLLIGYYHGLLLRDIDADLLTGLMYSNQLLTTGEQNVICTGHSVHHRNWLLLECVRHIEHVALLSMFFDLVEEGWPKIGSQFNTGMKAVST